MVITIDDFQIHTGVSINYYSDSRAGTVIDLRGTDKRPIVVVQEDKSTRTDKRGMSDVQTYEYERDSGGVIHTYKFVNGIPRYLDSDGKVCEGPRLGLGRRTYHDFSH